MRPRAAFLDRDGVINRAPVRDGTPRSPRDPTELEPHDGVAEALERRRRGGLRLIGASFMVDDRCRDMQAARRAGCTTILVDHGYQDNAAADVRVRSLPEAAEWILAAAEEEQV